MKAYNKTQLFILKATIKGFMEEAKKIQKNEILPMEKEERQRGRNRKNLLGLHARFHLLAYALMLGRRYDELEKNKALFEIMNRAFSLEGCDFEIEYEKGVEADLPNLMNLRKTGQLLILKAIDNIEEGNYDNAVNNCAMCLLLGTDLSDTKVVICFMTGLSLIEKAEVPLKYMLKKGFKADYEPVKTGLNTIVSSFKDNMVKTLEVERLCGINLFRSIGRRDLPSSYKSGTFTGPMLIIAKPYILADELYYMRYMKKIIDDMKKNPPASFQQPPVSENYVLSNLLITNLNKAFEENEDIIKECEELLKSFE